MGHDPVERELLEFIRGGHGRAFALTISVKADHWIVRIGDPDGSAHGTTGEGKTFAEAWRRQEPSWA